MNKTAILIPHYNNPEGLVRSLGSIHYEERADVFIVDDGSNTLLIDEDAVRLSFKASGSITFIYLGENKGIETALNTGLSAITATQKYTYIARLDSDDQCIGNRFFIQEQYMDTHPDIMLLGCNAHAVDSDGNTLYDLIFPETNGQIKKKMHVNSMFLHPGVIIRASVLSQVGLYPLGYPAAEDYALFFKIVKHYKAENLQQFLVKYEINPSGISATRRKKQVQSRLRIMADNFYFGFYPVYGILRSLLLYVMPTGLILAIKKKLSK
ncbi:glycosyltransferase [Flavobacterium sp. RNTU_13]|uniref:glycosyltransferase n=1 Tax=Flavobacterium sp. RNTU_13 TaxID=3375145 RepID=UPI0039858B6F